jgi:hypothetical protein
MSEEITEDKFDMVPGVLLFRRRHNATRIGEK